MTKISAFLHNLMLGVFGGVGVLALMLSWRYFQSFMFVPDFGTGKRVFDYKIWQAVRQVYTHNTEVWISTTDGVSFTDIPTDDLVDITISKFQFDYLITIPVPNNGSNKFNFAMQPNASESQPLRINTNKLSLAPYFVRKEAPPRRSKSGALLVISGYDFTALVTKDRRLPEDFKPNDLVNLRNYPSIKLITGMSYELRKEAAESLAKLFIDLRKAGLDATVTSTFRSYQSQVRTFASWESGSDYNEALRFSALPGHSEHQLGTTFDVVTAENNLKLDGRFVNTKVAKWLFTNAYKYGFVMSYPQGKEKITGYAYEPWHYRYIGIDNVKKFRDSGKATLTEWLQTANR